jgi:drug/metabolite transporter (DMT)-like permease
MNLRVFKYDSVMLLTACIWGMAFVAQRVGMEYIGPFTFNALRFALGALVLIPIILIRNKNVSLRGSEAERSSPLRSSEWTPTAQGGKGGGAARFSPPVSWEELKGGQSFLSPYLSSGENKGSKTDYPPRFPGGNTRGGTALLVGGIFAGLALFGGSTFQQIGIVYTTAGKAGFITGLYVILVPILGVFWGQKIGLGTWSGAILAVIGLYLLTMSAPFAMNLGDGLVLICAFFWAIHVHVIGYFSPRVDTIKLAFLQFSICAILSLVIAIVVETSTIAAILDAAIPILYAGLMSVGIAYTLQVVAQRYVPASHAAIILSLEAVFAVIGGWVILGEVLSLRGFIGCGLMLAGMVVSQIYRYPVESSC